MQGLWLYYTDMQLEASKHLPIYLAPGPIAVQSWYSPLGREFRDSTKQVEIPVKLFIHLQQACLEERTSQIIACQRKAVNVLNEGID